MGAAAPNVDIVINGRVADADFVSYVVDRDMNQPDMASIVLSNQNDIHTAAMDDRCVRRVQGRQGRHEHLQGEIVGVSRSTRGARRARSSYRAMNKLHLLLRSGSRSRHGQERSADHQPGLRRCRSVAQWKHEKSITYKTSTSTPQTSSSSACVRPDGLPRVVRRHEAVREEPDFSKVSEVKLSTDKVRRPAVVHAGGCPGGGRQEGHRAGLESETKEVITGEASAGTAVSARRIAVTASGNHGNDETFTVDHPIWARKRRALAKARARSQT